MHDPAVGHSVSDVEVAEVLHHSFEEKVHTDEERAKGEYIRVHGELEKISKDGMEGSSCSTSPFAPRSIRTSEFYA